MSNKIYLIGLGHRARNGKDSVAEFIRQTEPNTIIYHFADPLKEEVMNKDRKIPLIYREKSRFANHYWYSVWSHDGEYRTIAEEHMTFLHKIFEDRKINEYWGMDGNGSDDKKDGPMLQFWGTNWRRQRFSQSYWVDKVEKYFVDTILTNCDVEKSHPKKINENLYFLLSDTRFRNEVKWIRTVSKNYFDLDIVGAYLKVVRYNEDGTPYYDPDRDPNHQSEVDLEGVEPNYLIEAKSGEMEVLREKTVEFLEHIKLNLSYVVS